MMLAINSAFMVGLAWNCSRGGVAVEGHEEFVRQIDGIAEHDTPGIEHPGGRPGLDLRPVKDVLVIC
jgi:hypothetical protein